jgi:hypothetical protein
MPLTAIALILEFTRVGQDFLFPIIFAVSGSLAADRLCSMYISAAPLPSVPPEMKAT